MGNFGPAELIWLVVLFGLALIPAKIAANKGYSFIGFYVFGVFLWLIAVTVAVLLKPRERSAQPYPPS